VANIPQGFLKKKNDGPQTLQGNGAFPPAIKRDAPGVTSRKQLSDSRRQAIRNMGTAEANSPHTTPTRAKRTTTPFAKRS
jgi:hypothetical protein